MAEMSVHEFELALPHGIRLACRANRPAQEWQPGAARVEPRVLLLHGFPEAAFAWDEIQQRLSERAACIAPDMRGFGKSSSPSEVPAYRARHLVQDVAALIAAIGSPVDLLVAHDWGGAVAWNLAAQQPSLLGQLLIINSPHPAAFLRELRASAQQQQASAYMNFLCRPDAERLLAEHDFARLWPFLCNGLDQAPPWLDAAMRERYRLVWRQGLTGGLNYYRASPLRPSTGGAGDALQQIVFDPSAVTVTVPTTVLWGEGDVALLPGLLEGLEAWVPRLQVHRVAQATHWIVHEQPERVCRTIEGLLRAGAQTTT